VIRAFWFVTSRSFKNRILLRLRRLRNVRYLISFIAGLAYLWFMFFRRMWMAPHRVNVSTFPTNSVFVDVAAVCVLLAVILVWAWPEQSGGLTFSQAEIQFLFPAPISRRRLLLYKIFRQQPQILISATMMTIFGLRQARFFGLWITFAVLSSYFTMVALARARLKLMGIGFLGRLIGVTILIVLLGAVFVHAFHISGMSSAEIQDARAAFRAIDSPLHTPLIATILFIPRFFASALLPQSIAQQAASCAALLVLGAIFLALAAQMNVHFEEASIRASERHVARIARRRGQRTGRFVMFRNMPPLFRLRTKRPEVAIVWKNLIASTRISAAWIAVIVVIAAMMLIPNLITGQEFLRGVGATLALCFAGFFPFFGSQMFSQDLRLELPDMELLKSFPISGERLVAAEIATPLLLTSVVEMILLSIAAVMTYRSHAPLPLGFFGTPQFVVVALLFTIPICAAQLVIRNAVVVLIPGWAVRSGEDQRGFVVIGQRLVLLGGNLLVLLFTLIPAALLFIPAFLLSRAYFAGSAAVMAVATMPSVALLVFEVWMAIKFLGAQFDKVDVTNEVGVSTI
jgi:ABC-2 type transport system permease protein